MIHRHVQGMSFSETILAITKTLPRFNSKSDLPEASLNRYNEGGPGVGAAVVGLSNLGFLLIKICLRIDVAGVCKFLLLQVMILSFSLWELRCLHVVINTD